MTQKVDNNCLARNLQQSHPENIYKLFCSTFLKIIINFKYQKFCKHPFNISWENQQTFINFIKGKAAVHTAHIKQLESHLRGS